MSEIILPFPEIPEGKKRFGTKLIKLNGAMRQAIFIDDEMLDWSINMHDFAEAKAMGPKYFSVIQQDIVRHFVGSVSDFLGRHVTIEEINLARKNGYI